MVSVRRLVLHSRPATGSFLAQALVAFGASRNTGGDLAH